MSTENPAVDALLQKVREGKIFTKPDDRRIYAKGRGKEPLQDIGVDTVPFPRKGVVLINQGSLREKLAPESLEQLIRALSEKVPSARLSL